MFARLVSSAASLTIAGLMALAPAHAQASTQTEVALSGDVKLVQTVEENGSSVTRLVAPDQVVPGDRLLFTTVYENNTGAVVEDFVVNNPLPEAVMLAENGDFEVSVDGGTSFALLERLAVVDADGARTPATPADVTHLRWTFDRLEPGAKGNIEFFAVIR